MDFEFTPEQAALRKAIFDFAANEVPQSYASELEQKAEWPFDLYRKAVERGWVSLPFPKEYGGGGGGVIDMSIIMEGLTYSSPMLGMGWGHSVVFGGGAIHMYGNEEQKQRFLPKLCNGEIVMCFALTEPNAGSDAAGLQSTAVEDNGDFILNGNKVFISGATAADYAVTFARTDKNVPKHRGLTAFVIDLKGPGVTVRTLKKMGCWPVHSCEIFYKNARVPAENVLGGVNQGWSNMLKSLDIERIVAAGAICTGFAQRVVDDLIRHAREIKKFGQPLIKQQHVGYKIVEMQAEVEAARTLFYRAAWMMDNKIPCSKDASIAKIIASEGLIRIANEAMEILAPYGYFSDWDLERQFRDARMHLMGAGTTQIQRNILAREMAL